MRAMCVDGILDQYFKALHHHGGECYWAVVVVAGLAGLFRDMDDGGPLKAAQIAQPFMSQVILQLKKKHICSPLVLFLLSHVQDMVEQPGLIR